MSCNGKRINYIIHRCAYTKRRIDVISTKLNNMQQLNDMRKRRLSTVLKLLLGILVSHIRAPVLKSCLCLPSHLPVV